MDKKAIYNLSYGVFMVSTKVKWLTVVLQTLVFR